MSIAENLAQVRKEIEAAARRAGRDPAEIKLVAVSKTVPAEVIAQAVEAGVDALGENRVQEALGKQEEVPGAAWHLIGHLQTNKVKKVIGKFELIHSLDSIRLAREIGRRPRSWNHYRYFGTSQHRQGREQVRSASRRGASFYR